MHRCNFSTCQYMNGVSSKCTWGNMVAPAIFIFQMATTAVTPTDMHDVTPTRTNFAHWQRWASATFVPVRLHHQFNCGVTPPRQHARGHAITARTWLTGRDGHRAPLCARRVPPPNAGVDQTCNTRYNPSRHTCSCPRNSCKGV